MFPSVPGTLPHVDRYLVLFLFLVFLKFVFESLPFKLAKIKNLSILQASRKAVPCGNNQRRKVRWTGSIDTRCKTKSRRQRQVLLIG